MYPNSRSQNDRNKSVNARFKKDNEEERKKLIERLAITLKMKYGKLFKENNYEIRNLITDLNEIVKLNDSPYETYLIQIEKLILVKVNNKHSLINDQNNKILATDMKKINSLIKEPIPSENKQIKKGQIFKKSGKSLINLKSKVSNTLDTDNTYVRQIIDSTVEDKNWESEKLANRLEKIKIKKDDEWAKLANYNYNKYQEELHKTKLKEEEKKKQMRENLARQILEKQSFTQKEKDYEQDFLKRQKEILSQQDMKEKIKHDEILNKIKNEKEIRDRIVNESHKLKKKAEELAENEEKKFLDKIKKDMVSEEEKLHKKKKEEKEMYKNLIKENEERLKFKKEEKEKEKLENMKAIENFAKLIDKQDQDRLNQQKSRIDKINSFMDKFGEGIKNDEQATKLREEKRFLREIQENEKRQVEKEKEEKEKKRLLNLQIKNTLDQQINEKKNTNQELKNLDKKYEKDILTQLNKYDIEKKQKALNEKERSKKYKEELINQVKEKTKYQAPSMNDQERLMNRIDEIVPKK
jgi:hypothetical protein